MQSAFREWQVAWLDPSLGPRQGGAKAREVGWSLASQDLRCQAEQPDFILKTEPGDPYWEPSNLEGHPAAGAQDP